MSDDTYSEEAPGRANGGPAPPPLRRPGRPALDDSAALSMMALLIDSGQARSAWAAAHIVAGQMAGHSFESAAWRLYRKFRARTNGPPAPPGGNAALAQAGAVSASGSVAA